MRAVRALVSVDEVLERVFGPQRVVSGSPAQGVAGRSGDQLVGAAAAQHQVAPRPTAKQIVPLASVKELTPVAADERVVAVTSVQSGVLEADGLQDVASWPADENRAGVAVIDELV